MAVEPTKIAFGDSSLAIAIDTSGSTYGQTLAAETAAIRQILGLLPPISQTTVPILPWSDTAGCVSFASRMSSLISRGGTDPSSLYRVPSSLNALKSSHVWFLMTDGQIQEQLVQTFANNTAALGLHSRACVVVVFGSMMARRPAMCDISVGKAAYALTPDCLFLFHDVATAKVFIMQAKGCFKTLLSRGDRAQTNPSLNDYTSWADLPQVSYEDLAAVQITLRQPVGREEMVLDNNAVLDIQQLYAGSADANTVEALLRDQDNLKSLVIAETARGRVGQLQSWLGTQNHNMPELSTDRPDVDGAAQQVISRLLAVWSDPSCFKERSSLQKKLRAAHARNRLAFEQTVTDFEKQKREVQKKSDHVQAAYAQSQSLSDFSARRARKASEFSIGWEIVESETTPVDRASTVKQSNTKIFLPNFSSSLGSHQDDCRDKCIMCQEVSIMTLLLTADNAEAATPNFPRQGSATDVPSPLAMGSFDETAVLSFFLCCDACAYHLVRNLTSPLGERVIAALPLVDIEANEDAWLDALDKAFRGRFARHCIFQVFLGTIDNRRQANNSRDAASADKKSFDTAARWVQYRLVKVESTGPPLNALVHRRKSRNMQLGTRSKVLESQVFLDPALPTNTEIAVLRYPMTGFAVIMRLLAILGWSESKMQRYLSLRLLFEIVENFVARKHEVGPEQVEAEWRQKLNAFSAVDTTDPTTSTIPARRLLELQMVHEDVYTELDALRGEKSMTEWLVYGGRSFVEALVGTGRNFDNASAAFNSLKVRPELANVMQGSERPLTIRPKRP